MRFPMACMVSTLLILSGCATGRPTFDWPGFNQPETETETNAGDEVDEDCDTPHSSFWRKLIPWDHEDDTRPYEERRQEFEQKFRNNG